MKKVFVLLIAMLCLAGFATAAEAPHNSRSSPLNFDAGFGPLLAVPGIVISQPAFMARDVAMTSAAARVTDLLNGRQVLIAYHYSAQAPIARHNRSSACASPLALPTYSIDLRRFATIHDTRARPASYPRRT